MIFGPLAAVNVISGERERKSLELLFLTSISSPSLLLQKFSGAVTLLALLPLTFLPAAVNACYYGGISPEALLLWYLVLAVLITFTISVGMLASCLLPNTRIASVVSIVTAILLPLAFCMDFAFQSPAIYDQGKEEMSKHLISIIFFYFLAAGRHPALPCRLHPPD